MTNNNSNSKVITLPNGVKLFLDPKKAAEAADILEKETDIEFDMGQWLAFDPYGIGDSLFMPDMDEKESDEYYEALKDAGDFKDCNTSACLAGSIYVAKATPEEKITLNPKQFAAQWLGACTQTTIKVFVDPLFYLDHLDEADIEEGGYSLSDVSKSMVIEKLREVAAAGGVS